MTLPIGPYPNAPIVEAVIDIRVVPRLDVTLDDLAGIRDGEHDRYPTEEKHMVVAGQMVFASEVVASSGTQSQTGHIYKSDDGKQVVQSRTDGFTFSRLAPYDRWETLAAEAYRLWERYEQAAQPRHIVRLATRFINQIDLPHGSVQLESYLRTYPQISLDLPQIVNGYFFHVTIPMNHLQVQVNVIETIVPQPPPSEGQAIILDIDAFEEVDIECTSATTHILIPRFDRLRQAKNEVFEASITPQVRSMFF